MSRENLSDVQAVDALGQGFKDLNREVGKVIIGQDEVVKAVIISLFSNGHSLLVGVPVSYTHLDVYKRQIDANVDVTARSVPTASPVLCDSM